MIDIALGKNHDLDTSKLDLSLVSDAKQVRQQLLIKLKLWAGEWFLDSEFGTPYIQNILGKQLTLSGAAAAIKKSILEVNGVRQINSFNYKFSNETRILKVDFIVDTEFGLIEVRQ